MGQPAGLPTDGIVFQSLHWNPVVEMIEAIQPCRYSHCGILMDGQVIQAHETVRITPWAEFVAQGRYDGAVTIYTTGRDRDVFAAACKPLGAPYDHGYDLDDPDTTFCSKLVWQAMKDARLAVPAPIRTGDLYLKGIEYTVCRYYGGEIPVERRIVTPKMLLAVMKRVHSSYPPLVEGEGSV